MAWLRMASHGLTGWSDIRVTAWGIRNGRGDDNLRSAYDKFHQNGEEKIRRKEKKLGRAWGKNID